MSKKVISATITPLFEDGSLDREGLKNIFERNIRHGIDGVFLFGSMGEWGSFSDAFKEETVELSSQIIGKRMELLTGINATSLPLTLELMKNYQKYDFSAVLYYSVDSNKDINFKCFPADGFELFSRPVWSSIPLELQTKAKSYLEEYVEIAKKTKKAGNGLQLINICRYMISNTVEKIEAIQGKVKPFDILFVNHERIVLGYNQNDAIELDIGKEYALKMSFSLKESSAVTRDVFVTFSVDNQYFSDDNKKICVDCSYTTLQEEDCRFLYEKATKTLFV